MLLLLRLGQVRPGRSAAAGGAGAPAIRTRSADDDFTTTVSVVASIEAAAKTRQQFHRADIDRSIPRLGV